MLGLLTGCSLLLARLLAAVVLSPDLDSLRLVGLVAATAGPDLLLIAGALAATLFARRGVVAGRRRRVLLMASCALAAAFVQALAFINVEFLSNWGAPLRPELLALTPTLARYIVVVGALLDRSGALTIGASCIVATWLAGPVVVSVLGPHLVRGGTWTRPALGLPVALIAVALGASWRAPASSAEALLRGLSVPGLVLPERVSAPTVGARSAEDEQALATLLGPPRRDLVAAFGQLERRPRHVLVWVWESVGARHLRALHPLGRAETPQLVAAMRRGAVWFSQAYAESPLTVQSAWATYVGTSPPAKPFLFEKGGPLPPHGPVLHGVLGAAGYRTAHFNGSFTHMWGMRRILDLAPHDALEDADTLAADGRWARWAGGVEDEALVERFFDWQQQGDPARPFFAVLWNAETHAPYTWYGMPEELARAPLDVRYRAAIERSDRLFGRLLAGLAERALLDDTLVIVVGDHGEGLRRFHPQDLNHSFFVFEDDVHVPLVFLNPKLAPSAERPVFRSDVPCTQTDLFPTLLDLLGLPAQPGLGGASLAREYQPRPLFLRSILWWPLAIRAGRYKLTLNSPSGRPTLHDLATDPTERDDLAGREPELGRRLRDEVLRHNAATFRTDRSLGYDLSAFPSTSVAPGTEQWRRPQR